MTKWLSEYVPAEHAKVCAQHILKHFDLAPAGSLHAFVQEIARLARGENYKG